MAYDFDTIAKSYDLLNRVMTLGLDRRWRRRAVQELTPQGRRQSPIPNSQFSVLDVACGTGDMVVALAKRGCTVTGIDLSKEMLDVARHKTTSATFLLGDAEALPFPDGSFDAVTCAFGVRNFVHLELGLSEMLRVLKPGGRLLVLELATPDSARIRPFYRLYARRVIPWLGSRLAGNREAYTYLPESIERFPKGKDFIRIIENLGATASQRKLTFGVCRLYTVTR